MRQYWGDLWQLAAAENGVPCVTTNGVLTTRGHAVMGAGVAKEAAARFPALPRDLGELLSRDGNRLFCFAYPEGEVVTFPVKWDWRDKADPALIAASVAQLDAVARATPEKRYLLPRPGCGFGGLQWRDVLPLCAGLPDNVVVVTK